MYKTGMIGGSYDPLHVGHLSTIREAAQMCERLFVVLSFSKKRDCFPVEYRYRWLYNSIKDLVNVEIILLEDTAKSKAEYDSSNYWEKGRDEIIGKMGVRPDVVFCGSDYRGSSRYENLYGCDVHYFDRTNIDVSSTQIRENPYKYWDYIPKVARPYFVKNVVIMGSESTGKSTLAEKLAAYYNTSFVAEVGRDVCERAGNIEELMVEEDFYEILIRHKAAQMDKVLDANKVMFIDTEALTTKFYTQFLLDEASQKKGADLADAITAVSSFDLILFLEPTVPFIQDGTRNEKIMENREECSQAIKKLLVEAGLSFTSIDGDYDERFKKSVELVDKLFEY